MLLAVGAPCHAWLYDGGAPTISGPQVKDGSATVWVSQPFRVAQDSWVTSFGAAVARGFGTSDMGFNLYLSDTRLSASTPAIASGTITPSGAGFFYRYVSLDAPVKVRAGQSYYLTLAPNSNNFLGSVSWCYDLAADPALATGDYGQTWSDYRLALSVRVDGYAAVPELGAWNTSAFGLLGMMALALLSRRCGSRAGAGRA